VPVWAFGRVVFLIGAAAQSEGRVAVTGQWGMVPPRSRQSRPEGQIILNNNARVESVAERPTYPEAWLCGSIAEAQDLQGAERLPASEEFDLDQATHTDALLARFRAGPPQGSLF
jgi:hypothetical protein